MAEFKTVCRVADVKDGDGKTVIVEGKLVALFNCGGDFHAIDDACPHMGASLAGGHVEGGIVTCPWHAWRFRLNDGTWADNPRIKIGSYPVRVEGDDVQIALPEAKTAMTRNLVLFTLAAALLATAGSAQTTRPQPKGDALPNRNVPFTPKFEALAETRLLMEGMTHPNYRSLHRLLKDKPADNDTWVFARGQALLLAESGNLLLLRPPRNATGRDTWMKLAMAMRDEAGELARKAAARNHADSKTALIGVTNACNKCHQTFRINVLVGPDKAKKDEDAE